VYFTDRDSWDTAVTAFGNLTGQLLDPPVTFGLTGEFLVRNVTTGKQGLYWTINVTHVYADSWNPYKTDDTETVYEAAAGAPYSGYTRVVPEGA
jgi:hypothetical protein